MLKEGDVELYELFKRKMVTFINSKAIGGYIKNNDFVFYVSRFHINEPIIKKLLKTLKEHGCIEMEKHRIVIKDLDDWFITKGRVRLQKKDKKI